MTERALQFRVDAMIKRLTNEQIIEAYEKIYDDYESGEATLIYTWVIDELAQRDEDAFLKFAESEDDTPENLRKYFH